MTEPKMTVIIPTRERCDVLEKSLQTVTAQKYGNLEIIVSDNFSSDGTEQVVRTANDPRIRYINTGKRVSMSHNWEFALSHVTDGWVTIVGDDDGLIPGALKKIAEMVSSSDVKAIGSQGCPYFWPSRTEKPHGTLMVPLGSGYEIRNSAAWLSKVINGNASYTDLPVLYTGGWVKAEILNKIRNKNGTIYQSRTPDVYSGIAIASVVECYMYIFEPLTINGSSKHSTGASLVFDGKSKTNAGSYKKYASENNIEFHCDIPLCADGSNPPSLQALIYEAYLQSDFLRPKTIDVNRDIQREKQLELILTEASPTTGNKISAWGRKYAERYELNFEKIEDRARRHRNYGVLRVITSRTRRAIGNYIVSDTEIPIIDVYEAALVAASIKDAKPGIFQTIKSAIVYGMEKYLNSKAV